MTEYSKTYEFKDTFIKTCKMKDGIGSCKKTRESVKCIDNKCEKIKIPNNKKEVLSEYYSSEKTNQKGGGKVYPCTACKYIGESKEDLQRHLHTKHTKKTNNIKEENNIKTYKCPYCQKAYKTNSRLLEHIMYTHDDDKMNQKMMEYIQDLDMWYQESLDPNFAGIRLNKLICPVCGNTYEHQDHLKDHLRKVHRMQIQDG